MNERGKRRLEMARDWLGPSDVALTDVLRQINRLPRSERDSLSACADWVEDYERHESEFIWGRNDRLG